MSVCVCVCVCVYLVVLVLFQEEEERSASADPSLQTPRCALNRSSHVKVLEIQAFIQQRFIKSQLHAKTWAEGEGTDEKRQGLLPREGGDGAVNQDSGGEGRGKDDFLC